MKQWIVVAMIAGCSKPASRRDDVRVPEPPPVADALVASVAPADAAPIASVDASAITIVDAPMAWSDERAQLTLDYRRMHSDPSATDLVIEPHVIVLHYTAGGSAKATRSYFDNVRIEAERKDLKKAGAVNVSSHYVVDRDGTIYRLQPETRFARHCIGLNHIAIGIENVGDEAKFPLTEAQVQADAALVRDLTQRFHITHLFGHYEVMKLRASPLYVERDPAYKNDKPDPGARFMARVRELVSDLHLETVSP